MHPPVFTYGWMLSQLINLITNYVVCIEGMKLSDCHVTVTSESWSPVTLSGMFSNTEVTGYGRASEPISRY